MGEEAGLNRFFFTDPGARGMLLGALLLGLPGLVACGDGLSADASPVAQYRLDWPAAQRIYLADGRNGIVIAIPLGASPTAALRSVDFRRSRVLGLALEPEAGRLWVRSPEGLDVLDSRDLRPLAHWDGAGPGFPEGAVAGLQL